MITPILFNPIENNPYFWWNGLEIPIQLKYLFEKVLSHDETIEKLVEAVNKFNEEFEQEIKQEVVDKINEMYVSGELAQIIGGILANSMTGKTGDIDLSHMAFVTHLAHTYQNGNATTYNEQLYSYAQGNNVFEINGVKYWCVCAIRQNTTQAGQADDGMDLYVYRFNDNGDMYFVTKRNYNAIGHANGCCYFNGYIYITPNSYATGDNAGLTTDIHRISFDGSTLGLIQETKTIPLGYSGAWVDFPTVYNNELYMIDKYMNVLKYDWDSNTYTIEYEQINGSLGYSGEGLAIDDNYIYFGNGANYRLKRYNKELGIIDWVYQLPKNANNKMWKTGELEGFSILNGIFYTLGAYNMGATILTNDYNIWHFYRQDLATNSIAPTNSFGGWSSGVTGTGASFYVDGNLPSDTDDPINPSGLGINTLENPNRAFPSVQHVLDYIEGNEWIKKAQIVVNQAVNLSSICIKTDKAVTISGSYFMTNNSTKDSQGNITNYVKPLLGHIYMNRCSNIQIDNVGICNRLPDALYDGTINNNINAGINDYLNNCIRIDNCANVSLFNLYFPGGLVSNHKYVIYALSVSRSTMNLYIDTALYQSSATGYKPTPFYAWVAGREAVIPNPQSPILYCNAYNSSINTHGAYHYKDSYNGDYYNQYVDTVDGVDVVKTRNTNFIE